MSFFLPAVRPARCAGPRIIRNDFAPLLSLLDDTFNDVARASRPSRRPPFAPRFNVSEGSDYYSLEGELPGVEQDNIAVEFTAENTLTVRGRVERSSSRSGKAPAGQQQQQEQQVEERKASEADTASETQSVRSHQPTVEEEKEWEEVDTPATTSQAAISTTTTAHAEESSNAVASAPQEQQQQQQPTSHPWLSERPAGEFSRSFSFSERVDQDAVRASLRNGILSIVVPKAAKPENRRISIE